MKKNIYQLLFISVMSIIFSCSSNPNLTGEWKSSGAYQLTITQTGETYSIYFHGLGQNQQNNANYSGKFESGKINIGGGIVGDPTYSKDTDKISWGGEEFTRIFQ